MPLRAPEFIAVVDAEEFQVRGKKTVYPDILDALRAARAFGAGSEVVRLSDGKVVATVPGNVPAPPRSA